MTTIQSSTPAASASDGQRYARHRRRRKTAVPTIVSARRTSPRSRKSDANSQCEISALGTTLGPLAGPATSPGAIRSANSDPDEHDEQRRLREVVVQPLPVRMQERDPVRLRDRPDDAREDRERPEELDGEHPSLVPPRADERPSARSGIPVATSELTHASVPDSLASWARRAQPLPAMPARGASSGVRARLATLVVGMAATAVTVAVATAQSRADGLPAYTAGYANVASPERERPSAEDRPPMRARRTCTRASAGRGRSSRTGRSS